MMTAAATGDLVQLDPSKVLAEDNARFGTRESAILRLMDSILELGGIMEPVEVVPIAKTEKVKGGFTHRLTYGFTRHAAALRLNKEQSAGLTLPAIVREAGDATDRVKRQVAENNDRENFSPMDKAVAIKRLMDAEVPRPEIRRIFSSSGGRKGNTVQPMSNAMMNILLNLLNLPEDVQEKIHDGRVGVEGAYMLGKVPEDKRDAVLERAEAIVAAQEKMEESDEAKLLKSQQKIVEAEEKIGNIEKEEAEARETATAADERVKEAIENMKAVKVEVANMDTPAGPAEVEKIKAAEADVTAAQKLKKEAANKLAKVLKGKNAAVDAIEEAKKRLATAQEKKGKPKPVGKAAVAKAAKESGTKAGHVPVNIGDIRQFLKDLVAGKLGADDRVSQIAGLFKDNFDGKDTEKETVTNLTKWLDAAGATLPKKAATPPVAPAVKQGPRAVKK